jgi:hypothetical protein
MRAAVDARVHTTIRSLHRGLRGSLAPDCTIDLPIDTRTDTARQTDRQTGRQAGREIQMTGRGLVGALTNTNTRPTCAHLYSVYCTRKSYTFSGPWGQMLGSPPLCLSIHYACGGARTPAAPRGNAEGGERAGTRGGRVASGGRAGVVHRRRHVGM